MSEQESTSTVEISPVKRHAAKIVGMLAAQTGEGKTYSGLMMALGLAGGDPKKVGLLDTENSRGSFYSDIFGNRDEDRFLIADLCPPFSPARYIGAMRDFSRAGIEALVIDSGSHCWEGEGGCEEIAHNPNKRIADWLTAKREHKRFVNAMLYMPFHIIVCLRAREKTSFKDPSKPVSLGVQPICEKGFLYEATFSFLLRNQGKDRDIVKVPECLKHILCDGGYLTAEHGKRLREWVGGLNPDERHRNHLKLAASRGLEALQDAWSSIPAADRKKFTSLKDSLKSIAEQADKENAIPDNGAPDQD